jgi:mRNA interferase HicA
VKPATIRREIVARLEREGWVCTHGGEHDKFKHPDKPGRIIVPRHKSLSLGVARQIAKIAGW